MEESKELQGVYKIFRTAIYVSLLIEFFMYAIDPEMMDYWNGVYAMYIAVLKAGSFTMTTTWLTVKLPRSH